MARAQRLLEVIIKLQSKPHFTVGELADEFGVSRRTMLRDLHSLSEMGVPLAASPGPHGGYSLIMRRSLFPLSLSFDEAIGIVLSYEALLQYAESPFAAQSLSAVTKIRNAIPPDVVHELDRVREHVTVTAPQQIYSAPLLSDVLEAAVDRAHLRIVYDSRSGLSERFMYPYGLYAAHGFWYCACHDYQRGIRLSLRVDRVRSVERVEGIEPPPSVSLREWLSTYESTGGPLIQLRATVTRRGAKSFLLNTLFGDIALNDEGVGHIEVEMPELEIAFFAEQLLSVGDDLMVESPAALIEAIRSKAAAIVELYSE